MIHLDTNYLILANQSGTREELDVQRWLQRGDALSTSSIAWMAFVTGPVQPEVVEAIRQAIDDRVIAFSQEDAELAAQLFNLTGRQRGLRYDCMIAAAAIMAEARLATANIADFQLFLPYGLRLAT
ncbi:PIN domain-containing protein [Oleiharenicola lentus]|uniref:PIN domain-containing protein n=1 Tax=Oleiharenicola lentus TaxID=2508720 RepID=UPI003F66C71D